MSSNQTHSKGRVQNDNNGKDEYMSYLLPFRSLTSLSILVNYASSTQIMSGELTGPFIHWKKLAERRIYLEAEPLHLVHLIREFISSTLLLQSTASMGLDHGHQDSGQLNNDKDSSFNIKLFRPLSLDDLNELLEHMENASLLIPSSVPSKTTRTRLPKISLEYPLYYNRGLEAAFNIQSRDMKNRVKSRGYINMSSFTIQLNELVVT
jgi:hypothetical protein